MDVVMDDSISFCEEFVGKLGGDPCRFCLPKVGRGLLSCMGYHHAECKDAEVASIYVVYCNAALGKASPEDVAAARKALHTRDSVEDPGLLKKDPVFESPFGCFVPSCGLELYGVSVCGMGAFTNGTMENANTLMKSTKGFLSAEPGDAFWSDPALPAEATNKPYEYCAVSVGNFVYAWKRQGKKDFLTMVPVEIRLCRYKTIAYWMQYVDRKGRMYRFTFDKVLHTEKTLLSAPNVLQSPAIVIIADALSAGNNEVHMNDGITANVASFSVYQRVRHAVMNRTLKIEDLVTAVMPSMATAQALSMCNKALSRASVAHLKALAHL